MRPAPVMTTVLSAVRLASLLFLASLVGCGESGGVRTDDDGLAGPATEASRNTSADSSFGDPLASVVFGADGLTPPVALPAFHGASLTLRARTEAGTCFALASLDDARADSWVNEREAGPYCTDCALRTSLAKGDALFVLPPAEEFSPSAGLNVRFGLVRCDTLTPLRFGNEEHLELSWLTREEVPARGALSLRFLVSEHSMLAGRADLQSELVTALSGEFAGAGIQLQLDTVIEVPGVAAEARFSETDLDELEAMVGTVEAAEVAVDIVFAGCLRLDSLLEPPKAVDGFTPRVVGGAGPASAIFMPGRRCDSFSATPATYPIDSYAHTLAHELGHFLGLYHSVEADGTTDLLGDTSDANIMNHNPSLARARGFSPEQGLIMRAHPRIVETASSGE